MSEGPAETLNMTEFAQPAIFCASYLAFLSQKPQPFDYLIGHSVGEYAALTIAGFFSAEETVKILRKRGQLMQKACQGRNCGMLVVKAEETAFLSIYKEILKNSGEKLQVCELAVYNSKKNHVFSGDLQLLKQFSEELRKKRIASMFLKVSAAFHCSLLREIEVEFEDFLRNCSFSAGNPACKVIANYDLRVYKEKADIIEGLTKQLTQPVRFYQAIHKVLSDEKKLNKIVDLGSAGSLSRLLPEILEEKINKIEVFSI